MRPIPYSCEPARVAARIVECACSGKLDALDDALAATASMWPAGADPESGELLEAVVADLRTALDGPGFRAETVEVNLMLLVHLSGRG